MSVLELARRLPSPAKNLLKSVRAVLRRPLHLAPEDGGVTRFLVAKYCQGRGIEVGPGDRPYGARSRTLMVDRFAMRSGQPTVADVLADALTLPFADETADFLISSHMLEHHHDPLSTLAEWRRVLRPTGRLVLILPHVDRMWDRGRPISTLAHLLEVRGRPLDPDSPLNWDDYERISLSIEHPWFDEPEARHHDGGWNRPWLVSQGLVHYHVWTQDDMVEVLREMAFQILAVIDELPERRDSFLVVAEKRLPA